MDIVSFTQAVNSYQRTKDFDKERWIYIPGFETDYRYILGTKGNNPVIVIGINPSTASPDHPDNTIKSVSRIAAGNGFDSFLMFNVYPQRTTDPAGLHKTMDVVLHEENMKAFRWLLEQQRIPPFIWAAWGTLIEKRTYLKYCLNCLIDISKEYGSCWYQAGKTTKSGHPHHPLYLSSDEVFYKFDVGDYLNNQLW